MKEFNLYDILGVVAPGAVVTLGIVTLFPETRPILADKDFTIGDFGIVALASYILGNLVAAFGNILEFPYWKLFGPRHTERIQKNDNAVISKREFLLLETKLRDSTVLRETEAIATLPAAAWYGVSRRMYAELDAAGRTRRIEVFNAQFGMNRGIAAGFFLLAALCIFRAGVKPWRVELILLICTCLALYRMQRFSRYYSAEIVRQYLGGPYPPGDVKREE